MSEKISVVIITFNEAHNIERCLMSLKEVADEVLIVDSYSTDNTCMIAVKHGAKVITHEWLGYSATKNAANKMAANDWILSLDADEVLSEVLKKSIIKLKNEGLKPASFNRLTNYCGKWIRHCGWYPDIKFRIFNRQSTLWQGSIHETLVSTNDENIKPITLEGDCYHFSYHSIASHYAQADKFSTLSAEKLFAERHKINALKKYFSAINKFLKTYLIHLGFLDGYYGFVISKISAYASYLKYKKLEVLNQNG